MAVFMRLIPWSVTLVCMKVIMMTSLVNHWILLQSLRGRAKEPEKLRYRCVRVCIP